MQVWNGFYCQNSTKCPHCPCYHIWKPHTLIAKRPIEFTLNRLYDDFMGSSHCMQVLTTSLCRRTSYHHPPTQTPYGFHLWKVYPVCVSPPQTTMHTAYYGLNHHPQLPTPLMPQPINETSVTQNTTNPIKVVRSYTLFWKSQSNRITPHAPRS